MSEIAKPICKFCGSGRGFDQMGTVRADAWRVVESITRGGDGKITAKMGEVETETTFYSDYDFEVDCYRCPECEREEVKLEDLVGDPVIFEPGALVVCPDGFKGVIATVDFERRRLTVENWHEDFKFSEVSVMVPTHA